MNVDAEGVAPEKVTQAKRVDCSRPFFERTDWLSFGVSTVVALTVYLFTLSPEVTLEWSGMYATAGKYAGVAPPAGFPIWTLYAWLFTKILPFSNIAWRIAVSSAVAGALTCGVVALVVSCGGGFLLRGTKRFRRLGRREESQLRLVCGIVAGLGLAFEGLFWKFCVIVESMTLALMFLALTICLLLRWAARPRQAGYLYAAVFCYSLAVTVRLSLAALAFALPLLVLFIKRSLGRDLCAFIAVMLGTALVAFKYDWLPDAVVEGGQFPGLAPIYVRVLILYALIAIVLVFRSRRLLTHWREVVIITALAFIGLSFYLSISLSSMTNPPSNWGYPRTPEGFVHMIGRGQYEKSTCIDCRLFFERWWQYLGQTCQLMSSKYVVPALIPLCFLWRCRGRARGWLLGLIACCFALSFFLVAMMDPPSTADLNWLLPLYFPAAHLVLTVLAGYGLIFVGTLLTRERVKKQRSDVAAVAE